MPGHEGFSLDDWIQWGQLDLLGRLQLPAGRAMAPLSRQFVIDVGDTRGGITWWPYTYHPGAQSWDGCLQAFIELDDVRNHLVQLEAFVRAYGVLGFCEHPVPDDEPTLPYS